MGNKPSFPPAWPAGMSGGIPEFVAKVIREEGLSSELVRKHVALYKQGKITMPFSKETISKFMQIPAGK